MAFTLNQIEGCEASACKMFGPEDDGAVCVAVIAAVGNKGADSAGLDGVESGFQEVAVGQHISNGFQVDCMVESD